MRKTGNPKKVGGFILLLTILCGCRATTTDVDIDQAVDQLQTGETRKAIDTLRRVLEEHPQGKIGDRAALCLGNALIDTKRHKDAVAPLRRAAGGTVGPQYAKLLLLRAVAEGELQSDYGEAETMAASLADSPVFGPVVQEEAAFRLLQLRWLRKSFDAASEAGQDFLRRFPKSANLNQGRWLTAQSLREANHYPQAQEMFETIWYETPKSPWALESEKAFRELAPLTGKPLRTLTPAQHGKFVAALQAAGLHAKALEYTDSFLSRFGGSSQVSQILYLKTKSLHAMRRDNDCVATADRLRRSFPGSSRAASAGLVAIQCLRRHNNERPIRQWVNWIVTHFPRASQSQEALYSLGTFLNNVVSPDQGLSVLSTLINRPGDSASIRNAHWTAAWILRRKGRNREAADMLARLLQRFPTTGYRKSGLYWQARFIADLDKGHAIQLYQTCLREFPNDYYGHRSRENLLALGASTASETNPRPFPRVDLLDDPGSRPSPGEGYLRAVHLKSIGLYDFAAQELLSDPATEKDETLQFSLAYLYSHSGNPWKATAILRKEFGDFITSGAHDPRSVPREFWQIVYPYNYRTEIAQAIREAGLEGTGIDALLVAALIRHESLFLPSAISNQGALGLMQLMPATAEQIANERKIPAPSRAELFEPAVNIRYGVFHLAKLVREFGGDFFPAVCAYNAGSGPVKAWWSKKPPNQTQDEFIENIPYPATRRYVKDVLGDYQNYAWIYSPNN